MPLQVPLHVAVHPLAQPIQPIGVSAAFAKIGLDANNATPKIGKAAFAAFLKNSLLESTSSFFVFITNNEFKFGTDSEQPSIKKKKCGVIRLSGGGSGMPCDK
uniref:hypothetical protein n=1 Tax=Alistipes sp. TaxID=1872444 RepID=UPI00405700FA